MTTNPDVFGLSDRGRVRPLNEDQYLIAELSKAMTIAQTSLPVDDSTRLTARKPGYVFLVADGVGGRPAGERASALAAAGVIPYVLNVMPWFFEVGEHDEVVAGALKKAMERCQRHIEADAHDHPRWEGMGTTLTMGYVIWPQLYVVHVGDSRCYAYRGRDLIRITRDHIAREEIPAARANPLSTGPRRRTVLWNVLGGGTPELSPEVHRIVLEPGDTLLLATDGLTSSVDDAVIASVLGSSGSAEDCCRRLVFLANESGGRDNITVVVAKFDGLAPVTNTGLEIEALVQPDSGVRAD